MKKKKIVIIIVVLCLFFVCFGMYSYSRKGIPVIGYHGVVSDEEKEEKYKDNIYYLSVSEFEKQMNYLKENDYTTLTMEELDSYYYDGTEYDGNVICLTFDDGLKNFNTVVKPILKKYGFKATCFVIGKHVLDDREEFLKEEDIQNDDIAQYYSHSYDLHRKAEGFDRKIIQTLTLDEIDEDFKKNVVSSTYFAFPYGRTIEGIDSVLEENGVRLAFKYGQFNNVDQSDDPYQLPRYQVVDYTPFFVFTWFVRV